ncbi:MAG: hypothetical protein KDA60_01430 [Planctomycetales bacterium]|nr:hypothetical protein [Planctomycetales bacterium]
MDRPARITPSSRRRAKVWRPLPEAAQRKRSRLVRRLALTGLLLCLLVVFYLLVVAPFGEARTNIAAGWVSYDMSQPQPITVTTRSQSVLASALTHIETPHNAGQQRQFVWSDEQSIDLQVLLQPLRSVDCESAIAFIAAHGVCQDNEPLLVRPGYRTASFDESVLHVRELIQQFRQLPASTKLLIIDAGAITVDTTLGMSINRFSREVRALVESTGDDSLWVLISHDDGQRSYTSPQSRQSIFTSIVFGGLNGSADLDDDGQITLAEFQEFVDLEVTDQVTRFSADHASQTPVLIHGQATRGHFASDRTLLNVPRQGLVGKALARFQSTNRTAEPLAKIDWNVHFKQARSGETTPATNNVADDSDVPAAATPGDPASDAAAEEEQARREQQARQASREMLAAQVARGWVMVDRVSLSPDTWPLSTSPHTWRYLIQRLVGYETLLRTDDQRSVSKQAYALRAELDEWSQRLQNHRPPTAARIPGIFAPDAEMIEAWQTYEDLVAAADGNALLAWLSLPSPSTTPVPATDGNAATASPEPSPTKHTLYDCPEIQLLQSFAHSPEIPSSLIANIAIMERSAREAMTPTAIRWSAAHLSRGDRHRLLAHRYLHDRSSARWRERAAGSLTAATSAYHQANRDASLVNEARDVLLRVTAQLPTYLQLFVEGERDAFGGAPRFADLHELLQRTLVLADSLDAPHLTDVDQLHDDANAVRNYQQKVETGFAADTIDWINSHSRSPGAAWRIESLLARTTLPAQLRQTLLVTSESIRDNLSSLGIVPTEPSRPSSAIPRNAHIAQCTLLHALLLRMAASPSMSERPELDRLVADLESPAGLLEDTVSSAGARLRQLYRDLLMRLEELDQQLQASSRGYGDFTTTDSACRALDRILRVIDPRDAVTYAQVSTDDTHRRLDEYITFAWQRERLLQSIADATAAEQHAFAKRALRLAEQQRALFLTPTIPNPRTSALSITGPSLVTFEDSSLETCDIVAHLAGKASPCWIVLEFDRRIVDIAAAPGVTLYGDDDINWNVIDDFQGLASDGAATRVDADAEQRALQQLYFRSLGNRAPSGYVGGDEELAIRLTARRLVPDQPTRVVVKMLTPAGLTRHNIEVAAPPRPPIQLAIDGLPHTASSTADGWQLTPLPNHDNIYQVALANALPRPVSVDVQLWAVAVPLPSPRHVGRLEGADVATIKEWLGLGTRLAELNQFVLAADATSPLPFSAFTTKLNDPTGKLPAPIDLSGGIFALISEQASDSTWLQRISISPQRPYHFLTPRVSYSRADRTVKAEFSAMDPSAIPAEGLLVEVEAHMPTADTPLKVSGLLKKPDYAVQLECQLPPRVISPVRLVVHVDGYPRAFLFDVPTGRNSEYIPALENATAIAISQPESSAVVADPNDHVTVEVQLELPRGSVSTSEHRAFVGLDFDRNRRLWQEPEVRIETDRQVLPKLLSTKPTGQVILHPIVRDPIINIPMRADADGPIEIRAELELDGLHRTAAIPVILDGTPPTVQSVSAGTNNLVPPDVDLPVTVLATDDNQSGVERVEILWADWDVDEFPQGAPTTLARRTDELGWQATIPGKQLVIGDHVILARCQDRAGHWSETFVQRLRVTKSAQQGADGTLKGIVKFQAKPFPEVEITLTPEEGKPLPAIRTNAQGEFFFPPIQPGKYKLQALGFHRNRPRMVTKDLELPRPAQSDPLEIEIPE